MKKQLSKYYYFYIVLILLSSIFLHTSDASSYNFKIDKLYTLTDNRRYAVMSVNSLHDPNFIFDNGTCAFIKDGNWNYEKIIDLNTMENPINTEERNLFECWGLSLDLDNEGNPHVVYSDKVSNKLFYTKRINGIWHTISFDIIPPPYGDYTRNSFFLDSSNRPHIVNQEDCTLHYRYFDGIQWVWQTLNLSPECTTRYAFALDRNDHPHFIFKNPNADIVHVYYDGISWQVQVLGWDDFSTTHELALAFDNDNNMHFAVGGFLKGLWYCYFDGSQWHAMEVEWPTTNTYTPKFALHSSVMHLLYIADGAIRESYFDGVWHRGDIGINEANSISSFEIDSSGRLHISYRTESTQSSEMKYAVSVFEDDVNPMYSVSNQDGQVPLSVQFSDLSSGPVVSWLWDFGDGTSSNEKNPLHVYEKPGHYDVRLKVSNSRESKYYSTKNCVWAYKPPETIQDYYAYVTANKWPEEVPGKVYVINCKTNEIVFVYTNYDTFFGRVAVPKDGRSIFLNGRSVIELDRDSFAQKNSYQTGDQLTSMILSNDERFVYVSSSPGYLYRIDREDSTITSFSMTNGDWEFTSASRIVITHDDNTIFCDTGSYKAYEGSPYYSGIIARFINPSSNKPLLAPLYYADNDGFGAICLSPNGRHLFTGEGVSANPDWAKISKFNYHRAISDKYLRDENMVQLYPSRPMRLNISPDGKWLFASIDSQSLSILDANTLELTKQFSVSDDPIGYEVRGVGFTPDGKYAYVCSNELINNMPTGRVSVIDVATKQIIKVIYLETNFKPLDVAIGIGRCGADFDKDGDIDGSDLASFIADGTTFSIEYLAAGFGRTGCHQ